MKISHVQIHNFRSIGDISIKTNELVTILGPNSSGKSNILKAIEFALVGSVKPTVDDFHAHRNQDDDKLWVELTFVGLSEQEETTFKKYRRSDRSIKFRKTAVLQSDGSSSVSYNGYIQEPEEWWLKTSAFDRLKTKVDIENHAKDIPALEPLTEHKGRLTKANLVEFQQAYILRNREELSFHEELELDPLLGSKNVATGVLPEFFLIPAIKELGAETKIKSTTIFGRLMLRAISEMAERDERIQNIRKDIGTVIAAINERVESDDDSAKSDLQLLEEDIGLELSDWDVKVNIAVTPPEIEKIFELGTELAVDDGLSTSVDRKGHGLQRALIFALIRSWAKSLQKARTPTSGTKPRRASESVIFAFEEPELFLHPHAQRQLAMNLLTLAEAENHQIFCSTHSTHFVDMDRYRSIILVSKERSIGTIKRQCECDLFEGEGNKEKKKRFHMAYWINPDRSEMLFARKTVLVEGETEDTVLPYTGSRLKFFDPTVSIIDCGGKNNLPLYAEVLNAFGISYIIVHDEDNPLDHWNEVISNSINSSYGSVKKLSPDFEGAIGLETKGNGKGKALAALDALNELAIDDFPETLVELTRKVYE